MKIIVTHNSPDLDGITSIWLIKKFLPGWEETMIRFVPAGERIENSKFNPSTKLRARIQNSKFGDPIEKIGDNDVIHVDTGLGPLDHHQTSDEETCAASLTWEYVKQFVKGGERWELKEEAISRMVKIAVDVDHFQEVFWDNPTADYYEFSLVGIIDGLKLQKQGEEQYFVEFGIACLEAILHEFENRIWAEKEIASTPYVFETKYGKGIGFETVNDSVLKLAQKMGYALVVRKDPRKGYVRIKARPFAQNQKSPIRQAQGKNQKSEDIDLTLAYEKLKKMDPDATWFLHVSKKMLLNGTVKNPTMKPTNLSLEEIIKVLENV